MKSVRNIFKMTFIAIFSQGLLSCSEKFDAEPVDIGLSVYWASYDMGAKSLTQEGPEYPFKISKRKIPKGWRLPTKEEMDELKDNCTWEKTSYNNVDGFKATGPNGNYIFFAWPENPSVYRSYMSSTRIVTYYNTYGILDISAETGPKMDYLGGTLAEIRLVQDKK